MTPEIFLTVNLAAFIVGLTLTIIVLSLAARHLWLVGYGSRQRRLQTWIALCLIILVGLAVIIAAFNLFFS